MQHTESRWCWECGCTAGTEWACEVAVLNPLTGEYGSPASSVIKGWDMYVSESLSAQMDFYSKS